MRLKPPKLPESTSTPGWTLLTAIQQYECIRNGELDRAQYWRSMEPSFRKKLEEEVPGEAPRAGLLSDQEFWSSVRAFPSPTPYESHVLYYLLYSIAEKLGHTLKILGVEIDTPVLGTVPARLTNARVLRHSQSGEYVVILDDTVLLLARTYATILAHLIPDLAEDGKVGFGGKQEIARFVEARDCYLRAAEDLVECFLFRGHYLPRWIEAEEERQSLCWVLADGVSLFILGHEYGHILNGDLDSQDEELSDLERYFLHTDSPADELRWLQEHAADEFGGLVSSVYLRDKYPAPVEYFLYCGPVVFFQLFWLLERCIRFASTGKIISREDTEMGVPSAQRTHPPSINRIAHLHQALRRRFESDLLAPIEAFSDVMLVIHAVLTERCIARTSAALQEGKSLHPSWGGFVAELPS